MIKQQITEANRHHKFATKYLISDGCFEEILDIRTFSEEMLDFRYFVDARFGFQLESNGNSIDLIDFV